MSDPVLHAPLLIKTTTVHGRQAVVNLNYVRSIVEASDEAVERLNQPAVSYINFSGEVNLPALLVVGKPFEIV